MTELGYRIVTEMLDPARKRLMNDSTNRYVSSRVLSMKNLIRIAALTLIVASFAVSAGAKEPKKLLVVTVTKVFRHSSIPTAEKVLAQLGEKSGDFTVDYVRQQGDDKAKTDQEVKEKMTLENLKKYDGVIFANTTGDLPIPDPQGFLDWIKSGKGFIGMHSATDTFHGFRPFIDMIGGEFETHPSGLYDVECNVTDPKHPACKHFGEKYKVNDEIYLFKSFDRSTVHELLSLDKHPSDKTPGYFPIAWCKNYGKGKMFYTELGHSEAVWESEEYQKHILGGIRWALGLEKGDAKPQATEAK